MRIQHWPSAGRNGQTNGTRNERIGRFSDYASSGYCNDTTTAYPKYGASFLKNPSFGIPASATPSANSDMTFQLTSNTQLTIKVKGTDGTVRSANITLS